jgi:hypothetical protein
MKRNHGLKVKDKDKGKEKTKERTAAAKDDNCSPTSADLSGGGTFLFSNTSCSGTKLSNLSTHY